MAEIETARRIVAQDDCDMLGHANVASYIAYVSDAGFGVMAHIGLTRDNVYAGHRLALAVVDMHSQFKAELLPGDSIYLRSCITRIGSKSLTCRHRIYRNNGPDRADELVFEGILTKVLMDLDKRRATVIPDDIRKRMETLQLPQEAEEKQKEPA